RREYLTLFQINKKEDLVMCPESNYQENFFNLINSQPIKDEKLPSVPGDAKKPENILTNNKIITAILKNENCKMIRNIIDDEKLFNSLSNGFKLILSEMLANDKVTG